MFFILSKVLFFLLVPFNWILILLIMSLFTRSARIRKKLYWTAAILFFIFSNPFLYQQAEKRWQFPPRDMSTLPQYETGILLTGMINFDKKANGYFGNASDRFIATITLYNRGIIKKILITGGTGALVNPLPPEADFLRDYFIANKVNPADIMIENKSRNTHENGVFSKKLADSAQLKGPFLLITSTQHMRRSKAVFEKAGWTGIDYFPCDYDVTDNYFQWDEDLLPNAKLLKDWSLLLKEMVGLAIYRLTGKA